MPPQQDNISLDPMVWAANRLTGDEWEQWERDGVRPPSSLPPCVVRV